MVRRLARTLFSKGRLLLVNAAKALSDSGESPALGRKRSKERLGAWASFIEGCTHSTDGQVLPKLLGHQLPIGSGQRSDEFENVLVFNYGHFAAAGVKKSAQYPKSVYKHLST